MDGKRRPGGGTEAASATQAANLKSTLTIARQHRREMGRRACQHLRTYRPCGSCRRQRFAEQIEITASTQIEITPSTFGLEPDELRSEANRLVHSYGWTVDEVESVLAITRRSA